LQQHQAEDEDDFFTVNLGESRFLCDWNMLSTSFIAEFYQWYSINSDTFLW